MNYSDAFNFFLNSIIEGDGVAPLILCKIWNTEGPNEPLLAILIPWFPRFSRVANYCKDNKPRKLKASTSASWIWRNL